MAENLAWILRSTHILFGITGLIAMWIPIVATKGSRAHKRGGRTFEWCCYGAGTSGLVIALWWLFWPTSRPELSQRSEAELSEMLAETQFVFGLIAFVGVILLSTTRFGVRVIRRADQREHLQNWETLFWSASMLITSGALAVLAVVQFRTVGMGSKLSLFLVFPFIAFIDVRSKWRFARSGCSTRLAVIQHLDCMSGSAIAFCTAFLVLGGNRLYGAYLPQQLVVATLAVPTVVGVVTAHRVKRRIACSNHPTAHAVSALNRKDTLQ